MKVLVSVREAVKQLESQPRWNPVPSSFRDPAGCVICDDGVIKRLITDRGQADYELYVSSGLHRSLACRGMVLEHEEEPGEAFGPGICKAIRPEQLEFISYPYEWSFHQLKDAALLTLDVQDTALSHGMSLKDASAFNVQFRGVTPVFIDSLSFERDLGGPWIAYEQFCRHFLGPLLLMSYHSPALNRFTMTDLAGLPLNIVGRLLPARSYLNVDALIHVHLHAVMQRSRKGATSMRRESKNVKRTLVRSLRTAIERLRLRERDSTWSCYYPEQAHYTPEAQEFKARAIRNIVSRIRPALVCDFGANTGRYSNEALCSGAYCLALDLDPICVDRIYLDAKKAGRRRLLPLVMDVLNTSPGLGFDLQERPSFLDRARPDLVMLLALLHHLRISGQVPLIRMAAFLARLSESLLVEFVPKSDPMVARLLAGRHDTFDDWTFDGLSEAFGRYFRMEHATRISGTDRSLCLFKRHGSAAT